MPLLERPPAGGPPAGADRRTTAVPAGAGDGACERHASSRPHAPAGGRGRRTRRLAALAALAAAPLAAAGALAGLGSAPGAAAVVTGTFAPTGSLSVARSYATATALGDGDVLVAGGEDASGVPLASAELFHPTSGQWTMAASMPVAVAHATATLLRNGDVLVAGGLTSGSGSLAATTDAELYDPSTGTWSATAPLITGTASFDASAVLLPASGEVLYAGGYSGSSSSASTLAESQLYDPATGTWAATVGMPAIGVAGAGAASLPNGTVLLAGGVTEPTGASASVTNQSEILQPATGLWSSGPTMPVAVARATTTVLQSGEVLLAGGESSAAGTPTAATQVFDPSTGAFSAGGALPAASFAATATLLGSGEVLYAGGLTSASGAPLASAALYDPSANQWSAVGPMAVGRADATAALLGNSAVLVAGGQAASGPTAESELFTASTPTAAPAFTSPAIADVQFGVHISIAVTSTGSPAPTVSESGALPPGLVFAAGANGTATISGTPGSSSTTSYTVTLVAGNGVGSPAVQQLQLRYTRQPTITTRPAIPASVGVKLDWTVRATGVPTPTLGELGALPAGITFNDGAPGSAVFAGTPQASAVGSHPVTLVAANGVGVQAVQHLTITVAPAPVPPAVASGTGYWYATAAGQLLAKGAASAIAPTTPQHPRAIVAIAVTPDRRGYWLVSSFGGVFNYGDAHFYGSLAHQHLGTPVVAFGVTPSGDGYWLVTRFGQVYPFGAAANYGSPASLRPAPVTAFGVAPKGNGYWVVTAKGNVFGYGAARWVGSPAHQSVAEVTAFAPTRDGNGYWVVTDKGNVLSYGDASYYGSLADRPEPPVVAFAPSFDGRGYWVVTAKGNVFNFGDASFFGSSAAAPPASAVVAFAPKF